METNKPTVTPQTRTNLSLQRGNFYYGMGFALLAGLLIVVGLGVLGITSLGIFSVTTAMAMTAIAITLLSLVSFVTLTTLRRTIGLLAHHETALAEQAQRHADLADKVQAQWRAQQVIRDRDQDAAAAALGGRSDVILVDVQTDQVRGTKTGKSRRPAASPYNPFSAGQVHPVRDVEGIGEHYGKLLDDLDLCDTEDLWNADSTYVAGALKVSPAAVQNWQCMAELMAVTGIGKQYAELLVRADVSSIDELCAETAQPLLNRIHKLEEHQGNRIQGNTIGTKVVQSWINAAQAHHGVSPVAASAASNGKGA